MEKKEMYHLALRNGRVNLARGMEHTYISVRDVVELVFNSAVPARHLGLKISAKELLEKMAMAEWSIVAGPHYNEDDKTKHITIRFTDRSSYHLHMDSKDYLWRITEAKKGYLTNLEIKPWQAPGA